jgi:hypothetical protein
MTTPISKITCGESASATPAPAPSPTSGGFIQSDSVSLEENFTAVGNNTYQEIISLNMETGDSSLLIWFNAVANIPATGVSDPGSYRVLIDGSVVAVQRGLFTSTIDDRILSVSASTKVPISAGPHTIALELDPADNTWTINAGTTPTVYGADLTVIEVAA